MAGDDGLLTTFRCSTSDENIPEELAKVSSWAVAARREAAAFKARTTGRRFRGFLPATLPLAFAVGFVVGFAVGGGARPMVRCAARTKACCRAHSCFNLPTSFSRVWI
jgi:hypothetical protein